MWYAILGVALAIAVIVAIYWHRMADWTMNVLLIHMKLHGCPRPTKDDINNAFMILKRQSRGEQN